MSLVEISRIFFGSVFVLFIPGLAWSYVFFARKRITGGSAFPGP